MVRTLLGRASLAPLPGSHRVPRCGALILALAGSFACAVPPASPPVPLTLAGASGCYVVLRRQQLTGDSLELLFPGFFGLDTVAAADTAPGGHRVLLPPDDLARFAGSWSWHLAGESLTVAVLGADQGFSLSFQPARDDWDGRLTGWVESLRSEWALGGRRVQCPSGLAPAGAEFAPARSTRANGGAPFSGL